MTHQRQQDLSAPSGLSFSGTSTWQAIRRICLKVRRPLSSRPSISAQATGFKHRQLIAVLLRPVSSLLPAAAVFVTVPCRLMAYLWDKPEAGQTDSSIICLFIHLLSLTAVCFQFTSVLGVDGEKRSEKPSVNLTCWLTTCFRVVPQRPWAEVTLRSATLADNKDGHREKKSGTIVPSWMVCEQMVSPERVSGLPQRAENTLSYFLLLLWHFKLWNLIAKPADGLLNCPSCPPVPSLTLSIPSPLFSFLVKPEAVDELAAPSILVPSRRTRGAFL